jgi:hypothetical protein
LAIQSFKWAPSGILARKFLIRIEHYTLQMHRKEAIKERSTLWAAEVSTCCKTPHRDIMPRGHSPNGERVDVKDVDERETVRLTEASSFATQLTSKWHPFLVNYNGHERQ